MSRHPNTTPMTNADEPNATDGCNALGLVAFALDNEDLIGDTLEYQCDWEGDVGEGGDVSEAWGCTLESDGSECALTLEAHQQHGYTPATPAEGTRNITPNDDQNSQFDCAGARSTPPTAASTRVGSPLPFQSEQEAAVAISPGSNPESDAKPNVMDVVRSRLYSSVRRPGHSPRFHSSSAGRADQSDGPASPTFNSPSSATSLARSPTHWTSTRIRTPETSSKSLRWNQDLAYAERIGTALRTEVSRILNMNESLQHRLADSALLVKAAEIGVTDTLALVGSTQQLLFSTHAASTFSLAAEREGKRARQRLTDENTMLRGRCHAAERRAAELEERNAGLEGEVAQLNATVAFLAHRLANLEAHDAVLP